MSQSPREIESHLPLKPLEFSILLVLADEPSYGYGIVQRIRKRGAGSIRLAPGNLYHVLDRLEAAGYVTEAGPDAGPDDADERRHYYAITVLGRHVTEAEAARLRAVVETAERLDLLPSRAGGGR